MSYNNDIHIQILKWAQSNQPFNENQIFDQFPEQMEWLNKEIGRERLFTSYRTLEGKRELIMSFDDRAKLLDYEELKEARDSSKQAMKVATGSILIAVFSLISTICITFFYTSSVKIVDTNPQECVRYISGGHVDVCAE